MRSDAPAPGPTASDCKSVALECLNATIDEFYPKRSVLASELGVPEYQLSKMTTGAQAFCLTFLMIFSEPFVVSLLTRIGKVRGFRVERLDTDQQLRELLRLFESGASALVLLQKQREMRESQERRRA